jgi:hypothetical protein
MSFTDTLGKAFKAIGLGPTYSAASSLIYDLSSITSNDKPWTTDAFNIAADTFKTAATVVPGPVKAAASAAWNNAIEPTFQASYELGGQVREPVGAALVGLRSGNFAEAWKQRDEISFGQSLAYMQSAFDPTKGELRGDFNIFDPNDRKIFSDSWEYRTLTGAYDTVATTITDPLGKLGKGLSLARKVMVTRGLGAVDATGSTLARDFFIPKPTAKVTVISPETLAARISEGTQEGGLLQPTLKWFAENDASKIRFHPMVAASNDADTMAWLLGEAKDVDAVADTLMAVGLKDTEAMARLVKRKDLMFVFDKLKQVSSSELDVLDNIPTNGIVDDVFKLDAAAAHIDELAKDPYFQKLSTLTERGADLTKRTFADVDFFNKQAIATAERKFAKNIEGDLTKYPGVSYFQPTKYHPVTAVINWATERPANWINGNDSDSINELYAFGNMLRRMVGKDIANPIIDSHIERYLAAGETVEPKLKVAESFEQMAAAAIHAKLGVPADAAARIYSGFTTRRSSAMAMLRERKFLMTNDDMILKIPYLERQGGNAMPMLDLEKYYEVLDKNKGLVQALEGSKNVINPQTDKYVAGILNDTWKASVLLRLGYTVRNLTEASLSIMGKGYGLMWAGQLNADAVRYWYENRVQGIERWTDRKLVAKGVREDSIQARRVLAHNQAMLTANAALRKQVEQWAKAAEKAFENGKITEQQLSEYLQMSERSTGEQLYYGSPTALDLDKLDVTRPLAMTQNDAVAERYATSSIPVISASKIQQRLTGRAGRLPKDIRQAPGSPIGTTGVVEQMPQKDFQEYVRPWVTGVAGLEQSQLRGYYFNEEMLPEGLNPSGEKWVKGLKRTVERSIVQKPTTVYRGITAADTPYANLSVGQVISEKGFTATSKDINVASSNAFVGTQARFKPTLFEIKIPKGHPGLDIEATYKGFNIDDTYTSVGSEREVLLPAGVKFKVVSIEDKEIGVAPGIEARDRTPVQGRLVKLEAILPTRTPVKQPTKGLQTIAADMRQGFQNSVAKGHVIETYNPQTGDWREINPNTVSQKALTEQEFRVIKPGITGQVNSQKVFGRNVNIQTWRGPNGGLSDYPELVKLLGVDGKAWRKGDAWQGKEKQLLKWMRENEVGKLTLPDVKANNRHTVLVDPKMIETDTGLQKPTVELATKRIKKAYDQRLAFSKAGYEQALPKDLDAQAEIARIAELIGNGKYPSQDILQTMRNIADNHISLKADQAKLLSNLQARMVEEARLNTPRKMQGQGTEFIKLYDGTRIEVPSAFAGELGKIFASVTDNAETYRMLVDHPSQLFQARHGYMVEAHLKPTMPEYYSGYANHLNTFFRSPDGRIDPLIEIFLNGGKPEDAVAWLRSAKSADYRTRFNIDDQGYHVPFKDLNVTNDASDFAGDLYSAYQRYLPDGTLQEAFRNGQADEMFLRGHFADNTEMPDLIGRIVPTSPEAANRMERLSQFQNKAFHFLGSLPETTIARHPLARSMYSAEMEQRANIALAIKRRQFGSNAELTLDEINGLRKGAIEGARRELNKTLFTIVRKSYAGEAMRFMMPFFNAWENTIRRWSGLATESPQVIARAGQITQMLANSGNMLDRDGNPTNKFSYDNSLVLPMPETFKNALGAIPIVGKGLKEAINSSGMQVSIPIKSMDVIFQGEAVAGFGPIVAMPASELVKLRPDLEDVFKPILPFGASQSFLSLKMLVPPAAQKFLSRAQQDEQWARTFNTVYRYELIRYNLGDRSTEPTLDEIKTLTNNMYTVKMFSNLMLPFAAQYDSPLSFYGKQFRKLQTAYPGTAEEMFLQMYPEASAAMVSASYNPSGAQASQAAYKNTQKYSSLIGKIATDTPELVGFLVNDGENKYTFSDAVYQWQYKTSMAPGSTENFRQRRNPALLKREADIKMGWAQYNKGMSVLDSELNNYGFTSYNESGAEELLQRKQAMTQNLAAGNPNWYADLITVDKGKWIYRMQSMQTILSDPTWIQDNGNRPVVAAIAAYMQKRRQIQRELANRKAAGYSGTLASQDNADLEGEWNLLISTLKQESEFGQFYNRFLQNDPVTLG